MKMIKSSNFLRFVVCQRLADGNFGVNKTVASYELRGESRVAMKIAIRNDISSKPSEFDNPYGYMVFVYDNTDDYMDDEDDSDAIMDGYMLTTTLFSLTQNKTPGGLWSANLTFVDCCHF